MVVELTINKAAIIADLEAIAVCSTSPPPGVTRVVYSEAEQRARSYIRDRCAEIGLEVREDGLGNLFARWPGTEPELPAIASGSHLDSIPNAGRYDGTVGVVGAIEALRALQRADYQPRRSLELVLFAGEEPSRFGLGCLGSRALVGALSPEQLMALRDAQGRSLDEVRSAAGLTGPLEAVRLEPDTYAAFIELQIEQGPLLEAEGVPIGVVRAIAAPSTMRVRLQGQGGHAGAVLMLERRDALLAGAEIAIAVEQAALNSDSPNTVATTGRFEIEPGAVNAIPSAATLEIDVRDIAEEPRDHALAMIRSAVAAISARRHVNYQLDLLNADPPATCDPSVVGTILKVCDDLALPRQIMLSRAYHDSLFMARLCPTAMLFIPCRGGVSHRPDEYADPDHICQGVAVLAQTLARLSN